MRTLNDLDSIRCRDHTIADRACSLTRPIHVKSSLGHTGRKALSLDLTSLTMYSEPRLLRAQNKWMYTWWIQWPGCVIRYHGGPSRFRFQDCFTNQARASNSLHHENGKGFYSKIEHSFFSSLSLSLAGIWWGRSKQMHGEGRNVWGLFLH